MSSSAKKRLPSSRSQPKHLSKSSENSDPNRCTVSTPPQRPRKGSSMPKTPVRALAHAPRGRDRRAASSYKKDAESKKPLKQTSGKKERKARAPAAVEAPEKAVEAKRSEELGDGEVEEGLSKMKRMRKMMLEEAMSSVPEPGAGRVMYLVRTFERLLSIPKDGEEGQEKKKVVNWALPGLQQPRPKAELSDCSPSPSSPLIFSPGDVFSPCEPCYIGDRLTPDSNGLDEAGSNRRNSTGSSGKSWDKKLRVTSLKPFKLRTEQRGRFKEEHFINKVKEMLLEEEKRRIPVAQGLPWTTDEPECLLKPHIKDRTEPLDVILYSDVRAAERAKFDNYVAENLSFIEQIKMERERKQMLEEEEELRRLRKELVPRAQPMPFFDNPFVPRRSAKPLTVPKEPRFHLHTTKES